MKKKLAKTQERTDQDDKEFKMRELELKIKQTETQPQIRSITCKYCGYATPSDLTKCAHCCATL